MRFQALYLQALCLLLLGLFPTSALHSQVLVVSDEIDLSQGSGNQLDPAAAVLGGRFVVAWRTLFEDEESLVAARRVGPTGNLLGDEIPIDPQSFGPVGPPGLAGDSNGFTVTWGAINPDACVQGRRFDPEAALVDALDPIPCFDALDRGHRATSAAPLSGGGTLLAWETFHGLFSDFDLEMRRFGPDGHALGVPVDVVSFGLDLEMGGLGAQTDPVVGTDRNDRVVVLWNGGFGRRFDSENRILGPEGPIEIDPALGAGIFEVSEATAITPALGVLPSGEFVAVWQQSREEEEAEAVARDVHARLFAADARPAGPSLRVHDAREGDQTAPAVAVDSRGNSVVVWRDQPLDGGEATIRARQLNPLGEPRGPELTVNTRPLGDPVDDPLSDHGPSVALAEDGTFLVTWASRAVHGRRSGIAGRLFRLGPASDCASSDTALCLNRGRFRVQVTWEDFEGGTGPGRVVPARDDDSGLFWFFARDNWEMLVKVIDACPVQGHFWVFAAATTNVGWELTVTDTLTGTEQSYRNPLGQRSPALIDTTTFAGCFGTAPE